MNERKSERGRGMIPAGGQPTPAAPQSPADAVLSQISKAPTERSKNVFLRALAAIRGRKS